MRQFLMRLALECGEWDVDRLSREMSVEQLKEWIAFDRIETIGRHWRRTARSTVMIAASMGAKMQSDAEEMFLPGYDPMRPRQTPEEMAAELEKFAKLCER